MPVSNNPSPSPLRFLLGAAALSLLAASALAQPVPVSGLSPNPDGGDPTNPAAVTACNGAPQTGKVYRNSEVEPHIAVNPTDPDNMIVGWHQDRWSTGGGQSLGVAVTHDGGNNWTQVIVPFTRCAGGEGTDAGDFERASDPWISFSPDGRAHYMSLSFKDSVSENAMAVASSDDGGLTWTEPTIITGSPAQDANGRSLFHDKNTITADPNDPNLVYATWTLFRWGNTAVLFSGSTDGGKSWTRARPVDAFATVGPAEQVFFRQGAQIVVQPDGTLVNFYYRILFDRITGRVTFDHATYQSRDQGRHWDKVESQISTHQSVNAFDPELGVPVRDAGDIPDVAVNRTDGTLYIVWQTQRPSGFVGVDIARSTDGGRTWSAPVAANPNQPDDSVQTFIPTVAVNDAGLVGVLFYDLRKDVIGDAPLSTDVWLSIFDANLNFVREERLTPASMDLRQSAITGGRGYFPGDYMGLDSAGDDFVAAFTRNNDLGLPVDFPQAGGLSVDGNNRTDIVFARVAP